MITSILYQLARTNSTVVVVSTVGSGQSVEYRVSVSVSITLMMCLLLSPGLDRIADRLQDYLHCVALLACHRPPT